ncbi:30S ribosomal protein S20 [Candidatus Sumerlaeota bacterium]|nr:30S ribosomal protein S20 [Candidatus Sumerlaeota bacterium]
MPNKKAQIKHARQSKKRNLENRKIKAALYTNIRKVRKIIEGGSLGEVKANLPATLKTINKSAQKGIIHKRKAARLQSRMVKNANKLAKTPDSTPKTT